jgi:hypothetical protein
MKNIIYFENALKLNKLKLKKNEFFYYDFFKQNIELKKFKI